MLKWIFAGFLISMISLVSYLYIYLGFYKSAEVVGVDEEQFWLLYKPHKGAYHQISPVLNEVEAAAVKANIPCPSTFGLFLDDPKSMAEDRLRSELGCIIPKEITEPPEGLAVKLWKPGKVLHLSFDGSPAISPFKVYGRAADWFSENRKKMGVETLEVYSINPKGELTTQYYFPYLL